MAFARGRYGIEYHRREDAESHLLRVVVCAAIVVAVLAYGVYRLTRPSPVSAPPPEPAPAAKPAPPAALAVPRAPQGRAATSAPPVAVSTPTQPRPVLPKPLPMGTVPPAARNVERWLETAGARQPAERILLERLASAERQGNVALAIDTIEKLHARPTMADLADPLLRRLGALNLRHLQSGVTTAWTTQTTVRRGDSLERLARERRTTTGALRLLNPERDWAKLRPGDKIITLDYATPVLVVRKREGLADLSLKNGKFFKRYYVSAAAETPCAVYPVTADAGGSPRALCRKLGLRLSAADRAELALFLAPGSKITVAP